MQSRFTFLEDQFPKLATYGLKAERSLGHDDNICLLNLGRIAETVAKLLCQYNRLHDEGSNEDILQGLLRRGIIDDDIFRKINALIEIKDDAVEDEYDSEMACTRLLTTALELCEWFISEYSESRFEFLADLFPPSDSIPPLADLAEFGREAENNLYSNTRYSLICLGDIGEAVVDILMSRNDIHIHSKDQMIRIDTLFHEKIIDRNLTDTLHQLRMARNKAVHSRYASEYDGRKLIEDSLPLCKWLFGLIIMPGDVIRGRINYVCGDYISVDVGGFEGTVYKEEISLNENETIPDIYREGEKHIFKVIEVHEEKIILSLSQIHNDPWIISARRYAKYKTDQEVNATVKRLTQTFGTFVELKDGLEARIPDSELGTTPQTSSLKLGQEVKARVKWFSPKQYPYMLLSIKDFENPPAHKGEKIYSSESDAQKIPRVPNVYFLNLCKTANGEEISEAVAKGANVNAKNHNSMTPLMMAAMYNTDSNVIDALVESGADIDFKNRKGNTALMFAAMCGTPEVVRALIDKGADIEAINKSRKKAMHFARNNKKINNTDLMNILEGKKESHDTKKIFSDSEFLKLCQHGTAQEVSEAILSGANLGAKSTNHTTALMAACENNPEVLSLILSQNPDINAQNKKGNSALIIAAQFGNAEMVNALIARKADLNAKNHAGNTALHMAAGHNNDAAVMAALLRAGADISVKNDKGETPADIAKTKPKLKGTDAMKIIMRPELQKDFLKICRSGTVEEISQAIESGVNISIKNKANANGLMFAAQSNTYDVVDALIKEGLNINAWDKNGNTALIFAAAYNNDDVVDVLIDAGADVNITTASGHKAVDFARRNYRLKDTDTLRRLEELTQI